MKKYNITNALNLYNDWYRKNENYKSYLYTMEHTDNELTRERYAGYVKKADRRTVGARPCRIARRGKGRNNRKL